MRNGRRNFQNSNQKFKSIFSHSNSSHQIFIIISHLRSKFETFLNKSFCFGWKTDGKMKRYFKKKQKIPSIFLNLTPKYPHIKCAATFSSLFFYKMRPKQKKKNKINQNKFLPKNQSPALPIKRRRKIVH